MASGVAPERQRVRIQNKHPNPLFESLLMKWIKQASENENAKMVHNYKLALSSLKRYPLPLPSGKHCISLKYFGLKCCERLDRDMNRILTDPSCPRGTDGKKKNYIPRYRSGGYAILRAMYELAPAHIESSEDQPAKLPLPRPVSFPQDESEVRQFQLAPGQFEVTLIVDSCEVGSKAVRTARDTIVDELVRRGVKHQVRRLSVGDFLWIALAPNDSELVLPWIVERKRLDDLAGSIKDGRWKEQKFRLKQSGLDVFYMVEEFRWKSHLGLPEETVRQAVMNTWLIDGFQVINSKNTLNSVEWLQKMTNQLVLKYSQLTLESANQEVFVSQKQGQEAPKTKLMPFTYVQLLCAKKTKKLTVRDQFAKSLMVLAGVSVDKAAAITNVYPTPLLLRQAFQNTEGEKAKANLLAKIKYGIGERCIGPKISNALYLLYGTDGPS
ncbi:unnamed protein product [Cyprideis torosa]|uniref:Crossover junction endonuclease MUS81 n=1 Tax=Cyprideis torosa TaxID=163714 RepID=A0A7R8ZN60_9CRUS|nr:unnamed protein product [Cyprideis torosa]CAG0887105.1 unnamed protein product [Cyprideis torosa]